ncbi:MAG TPA: protein phosphatase 2C domain-containing protein [Thermoanaerobaculia bacterium]|nr:protein phosphatase 2C domain-containing protein [Thermoanaerobaculia bacterium]
MPRPPLAAAGSDAGRARDNNEDRVLCEPERGIFAVIDGVGGESGGEVAAQIALDTLRARLSRRTTDSERLVREAIALANKQIYERAATDRSLSGMACVLTVAVLDGPQVTIGHVGDSRLYVLRRGEIRKVTHDHSPIGGREDAGELSEAEAMRHPRRNEIFRDVGSGPHEPDDPEFIEVQRIPFEPDSALLLCSDGLSDMVASRDILALVERQAGSPQAAVDELIAAANDAGGKDNVSVVLVKGDRYAAAIQSAGSAFPLPPMRGAASARPEGAERWLGPFVSQPAIVLYVLIALAAALYYFREPLLQRFGAPGERPAPVTPTPAADLVLRVGAGGAFRTITEALARARAGQTVEVAPGEYVERIEIPDGVSVVSKAPRGAVLRVPKGAAGAAPAVLAEKVRGARLAGFRIVGSPESPLATGVRLVDSEVVIDGVEVTGATAAGIEVFGSGQSEIRYSTVRDNPGTGVVLTAGASPRLLQNLISGNGKGPGEKKPGVEVREGSRPSLIENRIEDNGGPQVRVAAADLVDEIFRWNRFGSLSKTRAIRVEQGR